jgi:hypothetical protein
MDLAGSTQGPLLVSSSKTSMQEPLYKVGKGPRMDLSDHGHCGKVHGKALQGLFFLREKSLVSRQGVRSDFCYPLAKAGG